MGNQIPGGNKTEQWFAPGDDARRVKQNRELAKFCWKRSGAKDGGLNDSVSGREV